MLTKQIAAQADTVRRRIGTAQPPEVEGKHLDEQDVSKAKNVLTDEKTRAHEALLVHPDVKRDRSRLPELLKELQAKVALPESRPPIPLRHPAALMAFLPDPGPEAASWPPLADFDLSVAGDADDRALDIVFDL